MKTFLLIKFVDHKSPHNALQLAFVKACVLTDRDD